MFNPNKNPKNPMVFWCFLLIFHHFFTPKNGWATLEQPELHQEAPVG